MNAKLLAREDSTLAHDDALALLHELRDRVVALERILLPLDEPAFLTILATSTGGRIFTVRELRAHARIDPALRDAIARYSAKQLGKLLRRMADGRPRGRFRLAREKDEDGAALWQVVAA